jgi:hypothetical protein
MILLFIKDCPTRHNPKKSYKQGQKVVISDHDYGNELIKDGYAERQDKSVRKLSKYKRQQIKKSENEGGEE